MNFKNKINHGNDHMMRAIVKVAMILKILMNIIVNKNVPVGDNDHKSSCRSAFSWR